MIQTANNPRFVEEFFQGKTIRTNSLMYSLIRKNVDIEKEIMKLGTEKSKT